MRTAIDTNIPSIILSNGPEGSMAIQCLAEARHEGSLHLSGFCYTEVLAFPKATEGLILAFFRSAEIELDLSIKEDVWRVAGQSYSLYAKRRRKSDSKEKPRRIATDFLIGAHALLHADRLMTLDVGFFQTNFPELTLFPVHR